MLIVVSIIIGFISLVAIYLPVFILAPMVVFASALAAYGVLPFGPGLIVTELPPRDRRGVGWFRAAGK